MSDDVEQRDLVAERSVDRERVDAIRRRAAKQIKSSRSARMWVEYDEFGGIEKMVRELVVKGDIIAARDGYTQEVVDDTVSINVALIVLTATLNDAKRREAAKEAGPKRRRSHA